MNRESAKILLNVNSLAGITLSCESVVTRGMMGRVENAASEEGNAR